MLVQNLRKNIDRMLEEREVLEIFCLFILQIRKLSLREKNDLPKSQAKIRNKARSRNNTFHIVAEYVGESTDLDLNPSLATAIWPWAVTPLVKREHTLRIRHL